MLWFLKCVSAHTYTLYVCINTGLYKIFTKTLLRTSMCGISGTMRDVLNCYIYCIFINTTSWNWHYIIECLNLWFLLLFQACWDYGSECILHSNPLQCGLGGSRRCNWLQAWRLVFCCGVSRSGRSRAWCRDTCIDAGEGRWMNLPGQEKVFTIMFIYVK